MIIIDNASKIKYSCVIGHAKRDWKGKKQISSERVELVCKLIHTCWCNFKLIFLEICFFSIPVPVRMTNHYIIMKFNYRKNIVIDI